MVLGIGGKEYWEKTLLLKDNPFTITSAYNIWAGRNELKKDIEEAILTSLITSPSRIILNWGHIGTGKTHASKYFTHTENIKKICKDNKIDQEPCSIYLVLPKPIKAGEIIVLLYRKILDSIGFDNLRKAAEYVKKELSKDLAIKFGKNVFGEIIDDKDTAAIYYNLTLGTSEILKRYLYMESTRSDLDTLGLTRKINGFDDIIKIISSLFNLLTFYNEKCQKSYVSEVFIWIDEFESINAFSEKDYVLLMNFLRDIVDYVPNNLTIFIDLTLNPQEDIQNLARYFSPVVINRVGSSIYFSEMKDVNDSIEYVRKLMNFSVFRPSEFKEKLKSENLDELYPFSDVILNYIITKGSLFTPRNINKALTKVLELAFFQEKIKKLGDIVDENFIDENSNKIFEMIGKPKKSNENIVE